MTRTPRTAVELLEASNDLFYGLGQIVAGRTTADRSAGSPVDDARGTFDRFGVSFGGSLCRIALVLDALVSGSKALIIERVRGLGSEGPLHPFISVAESLLRSEAYVALGQLEAAENWLSKASSAIVGSPFLELDVRIELLRTRIALRKGDPEEARRHLHRSLHTRDLLLQFVDAPSRKRFRGHARFAALGDIDSRLARSPQLTQSTKTLWRTRRSEGMIGQTSPMLRVFQAIDRLGRQDVPVLILGETGTGKELAARAMYRRSTRAGGPFMAIHCASLPEELFEAELFGYVAGSFTGAEENRAGLLEQLAGGTLVLDRVEELSLAAQGKILRVIDSRAARRIGGIEPFDVDVRFIATTSTDLLAAVESGTFRRDLYYRLRGGEIRLPPLRERSDDIPLLARHFVEEHARRLNRPDPVFQTDAWDALDRHLWPGNVRELETVLLRALVQLPPGGSLSAVDINDLLTPSTKPPSARLLSRGLDDLKRELERDYLVELFQSVGGDTRQMMQRLGVGKTKLYAWFKRLDIDVRSLRGKL